MNILIRCAWCCVLIGGATRAAQAQGPDPFAANNTVYPVAAEWSQKAFRTSNYDYPVRPIVSKFRTFRPNVPLTRATAPAYVAAVKKFIEHDMSGLINDPLHWSPKQVGWYDMPWGGQGSMMTNGQVDPSTGREALLGSYTGQILQSTSYPANQRPSVKSFQNHAVVYYNDVAAHHLGNIWKNPYKPDLTDTQFPDGSIAMKVEGVTLAEDQWPSQSGPPVLKGSSVSYLYRPSVASMDTQPDPTKRVPVVTPIRFLQMAVRIKDRIASPRTGWVFIAFAYDSRATGATVWDRTRPIGAMWGNDPQLDGFENGLGPNGVLQETWVNSDAPDFIKFGLGWGGRLAGPLDVGLRHNVVTVSGKRYEKGNSFPASSCVSCHGSAQYPFVANLYPSPNMHFPEDGAQFLFFDPGSTSWSQWFQNRPGTQAMTGRGRSGIIAVDYDMMLTFALAAANGSAGAEAFHRPKVHGH
ncbi:hypothetical protein BH09GEM1_BH09GEM1_00190 [soil metagenome]